jgi:hypothetical protein
VAALVVGIYAASSSESTGSTFLVRPGRVELVTAVDVAVAGLRPLVFDVLIAPSTSADRM